MKDTSQTSPFLSEITDDMAIIPKGKLAALIEREKLQLHSFVLKRFNEKTASNPKFTRAHLARRIGADPGLVTRWLSSPNNWRHDTVATLIIGICGGGLSYAVDEYKEPSQRNYDQEAALDIPVEGFSNTFALSAGSFATLPDVQLIPNIYAS